MEAHVLNLDKPRKLYYGFKAMKIIREKYEGEKELTDVLDINVDEVPFFAYVGLLRGDKKLTPEVVEDLIDDAIPGKYTVMEIVGIVVKAISDQMGVSPKKKVKKTIPLNRSKS